MYTDTSRGRVISLVELYANGLKGCPVNRILLDLDQHVGNSVRTIPRVVRSNCSLSKYLTRDRDFNGTKCRRNPKDTKDKKTVDI
jgi:hypothetical protein